MEGLPSSPLFWIRHKEQLFWIELDLQPDGVGVEGLTAHGSACILFLRHDSHFRLPQNSRGFIDRGFWVTRTGDPRKITSISQDGHEERLSFPVQYNCAFSYGVSTPLSSPEFRSSPVVNVEISISRPNEYAYLIETDVASWPDIKPVRMARNELARSNRYQTLVTTMFWILTIPFLTGLIFVAVLLKLVDNRVGQSLFFLWLAPPSTLVLIFLGVIQLSVWHQNRDYRRWVQSFAMKDRVD